MLHRDIKLSNIFLAGDTPKLVDFGLAVLVGIGAGAVGTPKYMAPEVILGGVSTTASDIYSFGVVAYAMLMGRMPAVDAQGFPSPPSSDSVLPEFLAPLGITQTAFATRIGITPTRLSEIIHGKRPVTEDAAKRFAKALGTSFEMWMRMQFALDVYDAMRSLRAYQSAFPTDRILEVLKQNDGTQFDQHLVRRFSQLVGIYPVGNLVPCTSSSTGVGPAFWFGGRYHFNDTVALTMRFGYPDLLTLGVSFMP